MRQILSIADSSPALPRYPGWRPQFTLRALFGLMTFASLWLSLMRIKPHWGVLILALTLATLATRLYSDLRRQMRGHWLSFDDTLALASLATMVVMAWAFLYIAGIGPAALAADHFRDMPWINHGLQAVYRPLIWTHDHTALHNALHDYVARWKA